MCALLNNVKLLDLSTLLHRFVKVVKWISQSCYMDISNLLNRFGKFVTWICQSRYIDLLHMALSKLVYVFRALCQTKPS